MRVARNFCIYRWQLVPACLIPDPCLFPKPCPPVRPYIFSETDVARLLGHCDALPGKAKAGYPACTELSWLR
jgi:hypothetical protein